MDTIQLAGSWGFKLDPNDKGIEQEWFKCALEDVIALPGTTDEHRFGQVTTKGDTLRLSRKHRYVGAAWYRKEILIPEGWLSKEFTLFLERCMWKSMVWIDDQYVGEENSLSAPHIFRLPSLLTPGRHTITIRIDNRAQVDLGAWSHGWSEEVQTIWNGVIGKLELQASDKVSIKGLQVYPDYDHKKITFSTQIANRTGESAEGEVQLRLSDAYDRIIQTATVPYSSCLELSTVEGEMMLEESARAWDEFHPNQYKLTASLATASPETYADQRTQSFGLRKFKAEGSRFKLNDYFIFLRGTHDAGNFPLTGYPAMDKAHWLHIYETAKAYGLNHLRFHSWCPPQAAFEAADEMGIILQAELPLFSIGAKRIGSDTKRDAFLHAELRRILEAYGNHPSFCLMCMGNELSGDYEVLDSFVKEGQASDPRHLYCTAANNAAEPSVGIKPRACDEFYVAHESRVGGARDVRRGEHLLRDKPPETVGDYGYTLEGIEVPTVSHEVGQWAVYPNFREIEKYDGVLEARNFIAFRESLEAGGMLHQAEDFLMASGKLSLALYREEIERSLRTKNYGGFQLLDIHDYPGQGTSLVGILDAFWDSKGLTTPEEFRQFCAPVVPLLRIPKRVFAPGELLEATVELANYSRSNLDSLTTEWMLVDAKGQVLRSGSLPKVAAAQGTVSTLGIVSFVLDQDMDAQELSLRVESAAAEARGQWSLWVMPAKQPRLEEADIYITSTWNEEAERTLQAGGRVLLMATDMERSEPAAFTTPFWNTQLFPNQPKTMGLLCNPQHDALLNFPTSYHTDWQWWDVFVGARAVNLSAAPADGDLIVQAIDHPIRNHKMGLLFERKVGNGRLLISGFDLLKDGANRPATQQLLTSLLDYMKGESFQPNCSWTLEEARTFCKAKEKNQLSTYVTSMQASSTHWIANCNHLVDGKADTFWMSDNRPFPHEIMIELDREVTIKGFVYTPLQDGRTNGRLADYEWYVSRDKENFGEPVAKGTFEPNEDPKFIELDWINDGFNVTRSKQGRYLRLVALSAHGEENVVAFSELDIITE